MIQRQRRRWLLMLTQYLINLAANHFLQHGRPVLLLVLYCGKEMRIRVQLYTRCSIRNEPTSIYR